MAAGDEVPGKVALQPDPAADRPEGAADQSRTASIVTQSQIVIVDPQDQKVVEVIE